MYIIVVILQYRHCLSWNTKEGEHIANYYGSLTQASTVCLGQCSENGSDVNIAFKDLMPMVAPNDIIFDG